MKNLEIECKLDANEPRAFSRAVQFLKKLNPAITPQILHIQDIYLDDASLNLSNQKIAFRVRNTDGKWEATFKTRTEIQNGKAVRREETLPLPHVHTFRQAMEFLAQKKVWQTIELTHLIARFSIKNKRTVFVINYDGAVLEISLDDVTILVAGRALKMKEIEIELKRGQAQALDRFAETFKQQTQLKTATISKVKTAELFLNLFKK